MKKKSKMRKGFFFDEVYREPIHVLWNVEPQEVDRFVRRVFNYNYKSTKCSGRCLEFIHSDGSTQHMIVITKWDESVAAYDTLAHECLHATDHILSSVGMPLTKESAEAYCYLLGSLVRRCLKIIKRKSK